ncbi:helix-turn-helix domain-containing protein [Bizionia arctica]|nr:helix-turn-helix domain-containing protein [Bizionia arctica]
MLTFTLSELFGATSSFLGLLIIVLILTKRKGKSAIKISLVCYLLILILMISLGILNYSGKIKMFPHLVRIDSPIHYLFGPAGLFYIYTSIKPNFRFRYIYLLFLIPAVFNIFQFMPLYLSSATDKLNYINGFSMQGSMIMKGQYIFKEFYGWAFFIAQCFLFYKFIVKNKMDKKPNIVLIRWFTVFFIIQLIARLPLLFDHFNNLKTFADPYQFSMNMASLLLLSISTALLLFPKLLEGAILIDIPNIEKYRNSNLTEVNKEIILEKWKLFIEDSSKPYLNPKICISEIADNLNTNPQRLSQVINEKTGMNFNDAINAFRIEEAKRLLVSDSYSKLTIDAIAHKSGFNSKSPFYTAFKKNTGLTPKQFIASI